MMSALGIAVGLFVALVVGIELGRWLRRRSAIDKEVAGNGTAQSVLFTVLGMVLAFSFSTAASRFDTRKQLIVDQSNALSTAWLRLDLLPEADANPIRVHLKAWAKLALSVAEESPDRNPQAFARLVAEANRHQNEAWRLAVDAVERHPRPQYAGLILSPLNDWMDLTTSRLQIDHRGAPLQVILTLVILSLTAAVLAGHGMTARSRRSPLHVIAFAGAIAFVLFVIIDLSHPRSGLIRVDSVDDAMRAVYESMGNPATTHVAPP
jgi:hypothetical protein